MTIPSSRRGGLMSVSILFWSVAGFLCLWSLVWVPQAAAQTALELSYGRRTGTTFAPPGSERQLYYVELQDPPGGPDARLRIIAPPGFIRFTISNMLVLSPLATGDAVAADIAAFNLYRSTDAVFDAGDQFVGTSAPGAIPGAQTFPLGAPPIVDEDVPDGPGSIFFILTVQIASTATRGRAFRFSVPGNHIDMRDFVPPDVNYTRGTAIAASDLHYVLIDDLRALTPGVTIPVGYEWVAGLGFFGYATYHLLRRRRGKTHT